MSKGTLRIWEFQSSDGNWIEPGQQSLETLLDYVGCGCAIRIKGQNLDRTDPVKIALAEALERCMGSTQHRINMRGAIGYEAVIDEDLRLAEQALAAFRREREGK